MERCFESSMRAESALLQIIVRRTSVNDAVWTLYVRFNWQFDVSAHLAATSHRADMFSERCTNRLTRDLL